MLKRYRQDYLGEYVVLNRRLKDSRWIDTCEWVENTIDFYPKSLSAIVFGQTNRLLNINTFINKDFTTYSSEEKTTFVIGSDPESVCYARLDDILLYPGQYHMIPHDPGYSIDHTLVYLAAFDGHKQIYLDGIDESKQLLDIVSIYDDIDFCKITKFGKDHVYHELKYQSNYRQISLENFDSDITIPIQQF